MRIELEIGSNLKTMVETFCYECSDKHDLGTEVNAAFGLNFKNMVENLVKNHSNSKLEEIVIKMEKK